MIAGPKQTASAVRFGAVLWVLSVCLVVNIINLPCLTAQSPGGIKVATLNTSLYREQAEQLVTELESGDSSHARQLASLLQEVRPDIVLLNEIDFRDDDRVIRALLDQYLHVPQTQPSGLQSQPLSYPYHFTAPVNTGVDSGLDLNGDGKRATAEDAWGYGRYPGQYGMLVLSRFPIDNDKARTFQKFLWCQLPEAKQPIDPTTAQPYYPRVIWEQLRLSSKSHWDVPIKIGDRTLHLLASHPTPPAFDGPEDRNGCRNHDEIAFWTRYIDGSAPFEGLVDDQGRSGGLPEDAAFLILGDLNADPTDGSGLRDAIRTLLAHPRVQDTLPASSGAVAAGKKLAGKNLEHQADPSLDTSQFSPRSVGNLRVDYCLPSSNLSVESSGVFWPKATDPQASLVRFTDHRLVWVVIQP